MGHELTVTFKQKDGSVEAILTVNQAGGQVVTSSIIDVSTAGNDLNDGKSWDKAVKTIYTGIHFAPAGWQVWVEEASCSETVEMKDAVNVYGGFNRTMNNIADHGNGGYGGDGGDGNGAFCAQIQIEYDKAKKGLADTEEYYKRYVESASYLEASYLVLMQQWKDTMERWEKMARENGCTLRL